MSRAQDLAAVMAEARGAGTGSLRSLADDAEATTVDINYLKSISFREVACDGVLGGPTPHGKLWLAFYTERLPLLVASRLARSRAEHFMARNITKN
jgi:hypothetical protein